MPQPIDLQTQLMQVTTAERVHQVTDRLSLAAQQRTTVETQEQRVLAETQVQQAHAKTDELDQETRRKIPYRARRPRKTASPEPAEHKEPLPVAVEEHRIDISI